jgi:cytochrome P450
MSTPVRCPALDSWGDHDRDDPFPLFAQVRAAGPVHEVRLADGHPAWLVIGHAETRAALADPRLSKDMHAALARSGEVVAEGLPGPELARHMLAVDPPDHTRLRRLAMPAFSRRRVSALEPRVRSIVERLLADLAARGRTGRAVDLVAGYAFPLPFTVISELLGIPEPDRAELGRCFGILLAPYPGPRPPAAAVAASDPIVGYLTALLDYKRAEPGEDLVAAADRDGALTEQEALSTIFQLVVAGHDTTPSLIGNATVALLRHHAQRDALVADPRLVAGAVEECLRFDPPVPHSTFRYTTEEVRIGDVVIPAFAQVIVSLAAANRDPARYRDAGSFDIHRTDGGHLAFGHGIHFCLGAPLAWMQARIALAALHTRFPAMRLTVDPGELHWDHGDGLVLRGLSELPVLLGPSIA